MLQKDGELWALPHASRIPPRRHSTEQQLAPLSCSCPASVHESLQTPLARNPQNSYEAG